MVGLISDRAVENFSIIQPRCGGAGDIRLCVAFIFLVLVLLTTYIYIPNCIVDLDYKMETAKSDIARLTRDNQVLRHEESALLAIPRLEAEAVKLGLALPEQMQIRYVDLGISDESRVARALPPAADNHAVPSPD